MGVVECLSELIGRGGEGPPIWFMSVLSGWFHFEWEWSLTQTVILVIHNLSPAYSLASWV